MDRADVATEQWARERPDLPTLPMAVLGRLSEAAGRVTRDHLNPLFASAGLQPGEFDVLATLRRSGVPCMLSPTRLYDRSGCCRCSPPPSRKSSTPCSGS